MKNLSNSKETRMINELKSMEVNPPEGLWEEIDSTLLKTKRRSMLIQITSWASAAAIALIVTLGGLYNLTNNTKEISSIKSESISKANAFQKNKISDKSINRKSENQITRVIAEVANPLEEIKPTLFSDSANLTSGKIDIINKVDTILDRIASIKPSEIKPQYRDSEKLVINDYATHILSGNKQFPSDLKDEKVRGNWFVSASGFPVYSYRTGGSTNSISDRRETGISSWGGSATVRYALPNRLSIETGIIYNFMGQIERNLYLVKSDKSNIEVYGSDELFNSYGSLTVSNSDYILMDIKDVNGLSTQSINDSHFNKVNAAQRFRYLEIPLIVSKGMRYKTFDFYLKAGVSAGVLIGNLLDIDGSNIHIKGKTLGVDKFTSSAIAAIGFSIPIYKNSTFLVEPTFKFGLKSLSNTNGNAHPYSMSVRVGVEIPI